MFCVPLFHIYRGVDVCYAKMEPYVHTIKAMAVNLQDLIVLTAI